MSDTDRDAADSSTAPGTRVLFLPCAKGLEYLLADELVALGAPKANAAIAGAMAFLPEADAPAFARRALLHSRLASRVLWTLAEFDCPDEDALYAAVHAIDWREQLAAGDTLAVDANLAAGAGLTHSRYASLRVKDAIVDRLRADTGERPSVDLDHPGLRLNLSLRKARAILSVDLGGGSLHRRGWRASQGDAPLKETLAAAVLLRGGWPALAAEGGALVDPMCGSGTLLIEGALMAAGVAPGLQRHGDEAPTRWLGFDRAAWDAERAAAFAAAEAGLAALQPRFFGSDVDPRALASAQRNADAAGLGDLLRLERRELAQVGAATFGAPLPARSLLACNPPYDARLQADPALYRALGDAARRLLPDGRASLLCGDAELGRATGLRAAKKYQVFNGALECALLVVDPIAPPAREAPPPKPLSDGAQMVANRIAKTLDKSRRWREREGITCWRAYDADLPEYAAAIDVYTSDEGARERWLHVQEYQAPKSIDEEAARRRFGELLTAASRALDVPRERIAVKTRERGRGGSKYGRMDARGEFLVVREGEARLRVNLFDYLDTGLFLDHRPLRARIRREAAGKRVLNLFAYTGAISVQAGLGGAAATTTVDLSGTYLEWAAFNLALNALNGRQHQLVQADAMAWLERERGQFDLIACDPPTFSNSARADDFDVQRAHVRLLELAVARLAPGGLLLFSNNYRRFHLDEEAVAAFATVREVSASTLPPDFERNPRIHRTWELRAR